MKKPKRPKVSAAHVRMPPLLIQLMKDTPVTPDDMLTFNQALDEMSPEQRNDAVARYIGILEAFGMMNDPEAETELVEETHPGRHHTDKLTAIEARLQALAELIDLEKFRAYQLPGGSDDMVMISRGCLHVAATAPLIEDAEGILHFDADDFAQRMLAYTEAKGTG